MKAETSGTPARSLETWRFMAESLENSKPCTLLYVVESLGSSPGRRGFFMAVDADGGMRGSIGGGRMEYNLVEAARADLAAAGARIGLRRQVHEAGDGADRSGMICSGEQTIWTHRLQARELPELEKIVACIENFGIGTVRLSASGIEFSPEAASRNYGFDAGAPGPDEHRHGAGTWTDSWSYSEKLGFKNTLHIVGGGHCSLALSEAMSRMDFRILVYDNRPGLNTLDANSFAHRKTVVRDYAELAGLIDPGPDVYVAVMTFGYKSDDVAVRALLDKDFRYFGLMGSASKIEKMFAVYAAEGFSLERLRRIHAPIGEAIFSHSPEEIAISVAAEIIRVKNTADDTAQA